MPHDTPYTAREPQARPTPGRPKSAPPRPEPCAPDCQPVCPACGGLQCLCRPRFFPGQLLTDEDLNRLERYVVEKNKLHNRYLVGWGVACGLEVVCDACSPGRVVVRSGYALSPCGDDIVLCEDQSIDVCDLIDQCRPSREPVCDTPYRQAPLDCKGGVEQWVIAVCYDESPSRGVTALTGSTDSACCSACGGSGSGSCGCGASATKPAAAKSTGPRKAYQPQCEPTQICEGHRFTAYRYVPPKDISLDIRGDRAGATTMQDLIFAWMYSNRARFGPLLERLICCMSRALELRATWRDGAADAKISIATYDEYLEALLQFAEDFAIHRCTFLDKIRRLAQDDAHLIDGMRASVALEASQTQSLGNSFLKLDNLWMELVGECLCSALLPACPAPSATNCVPLAVVTVSKGDCRVGEICNWKERKLLITWNTVGYWLSWLPWHRIRENIAKICCGTNREGAFLWVLVLVIGLMMTYAKKTAPPPPPPPPPPPSSSSSASTSTSPGTARRTAAGAAAAEDTTNATLERAFQSENLLAHLGGAFDILRTGREAAAPEWATLIARFADGTALSALAGEAATSRVAASDIGAELGVHEMRERIVELERKTDEYKDALAGMQSLLRSVPRREGG